MFLSTIVLALIVGALAGGGIPRLGDLRLRWSYLLLLAVALQIVAGTSGATGIAERVPVGGIFIVSYLMVLAWMWGNWRIPGLQVAAVGIGANLVAVLINGGRMPIWSGAYTAAGFADAAIAADPFHFVLRAGTISEFVGRGGLFGDVIPLPVPVIRDVVSIGDVLLALGIFWAIVYSMTRAEAPSRSALAVGGSQLVRAGTIGAAILGVGYSEGRRVPAELSAAGAEIAGLRRQSPYLRLVRNRNFSLLWIGQLVSLFGERIHTVALGFLVYDATGGGALEVGFTFAATAIPNVVLGPLAGTLVDRWDRRWTMLSCDLLRALLLVTVPFMLAIDVRLVYVMAFLIATVTLLFRPAKTAVIPAITEERDLVTANSMSTVADTAADLLGLPLAGILVGVLRASDAMGIAFALGGITYIISAIFIFAMSVPRQQLLGTPMRPATIWAEMVEGWNFLRRQAELFSNTLVSTVAQLAVGAEIVASLPYAERVLDQSRLPSAQAYALLLTGVAVGSVVGGLLVGAVGDRVAKGPLIIAGFVGMGLALAAAGLVTDPFVAIGLFSFVGLFNMLFIIPTITLFQQRTPGVLMGRVVSSRQAFVFGAIAISMGLSGWLAEVIGADVVLLTSGGICAVAGASGLLIPAMRNAR